MVDLLGHEPAQFVSAETAREMARAAYRRALRLRENPPVSLLGLTPGFATPSPSAMERG
jgi:hypothetical protein